MKTTQTIVYYLFLSLFIFSCSNSSDKTQDEEITETELNQNPKEPFYLDLEDIIKRDTLRAISIYSPTSFFLYKGEVMGFEYELLQHIADNLGVYLKIVIAENMDEMIQMLNSGQGDIIAYGMTITEKRKKEISFTKSYMKIHQVLIQKTKNKVSKGQFVEDVTDLGGKMVSIRKGSSYLERINHLSSEIGEAILVDTVSGKLTTNEIIDMVHDGQVEYTISDNNIAQVSASYYFNLDMSVPVSLSQNLAWMVRKSSVKLLEKINIMVETYVGSLEYNMTYNKYFKNKRNYSKRKGSEFYGKETGKISKYDVLIKKYAQNINWDWRLVASQIYQESRFDNNGKSWVGAGGLMQIMPRTAKELGVHNVYNPEQNIKGGTKYLKQIWEEWKQIPDSVQRLKLTLASYNCGLYHVYDAQNLAKINGKNHQSWDDGIDEYILKLSKPEYFNHKSVKYGYVRGREPYYYVRNIFERYELYKEFLDM